MIRFMGNGVRILHVVQSLCSDCTMRICHLSTQACSFCDGLHDAVHFMTEHGFKDVFLLELEQKGDL